MENLGVRPCLLFIHGFKGFKDWGFGPYIGNYFSRSDAQTGNKGFFVLIFNFSHNGIGENLLEFTELEKFAQNTFSLEIKELSGLIEAYLSGYFGKISNRQIGLLGHSRGGAISILTAKLKSEVNAVAVWSSVSKLDRYTEKQKEKWRKNGFFEVFNTRTKQKMKLNLSLLEDIEKNKHDLLNLEQAVKELNRPLLIAHGEQDLSVSIKEAKELYNWSDKNLAEFHRIPTAGHTYGIKHPFEGTNPKFEELLQITMKFFNNNLPADRPV
jgi:pimeloyl-ACP methyl ester carboxylesterase